MYQRQSIANEKTKSHKISISGKQTNCHRHSITDIVSQTRAFLVRRQWPPPVVACFIYQLSENSFWHLVLQSTLSNLAGHIVGTVCIVLINNCLQYFVHCTFRQLLAILRPYYFFWKMLAILRPLYFSTPLCSRSPLSPHHQPKTNETPSEKRHRR